MLSSLTHIPRSLLTLTIGRLVLVPVIIASFDAVPWLTAAALAVFIAVDLYDGVLARTLDADDTARRTLDTVVDRISIWSVYLTIASSGYLAPALLAAFGLREAYTGYWCHRLLRERDVVIRADWMCRGLNLMLAGWVIAAPFVGGTSRNLLFVCVLTASVIVALDVARSLRLVREMPPSVKGTVIPAGYLRSLRASVRRGLQPTPSETVRYA